MAHLPDEMWLHVANYFNISINVCAKGYEPTTESEETVQQTFLCLCLVSKQLRAIFQPLLYGHFVKPARKCAQHRLVTGDSEWLHRYYQCDERSFRVIRRESKLEKFLKTIILRPDLAAGVRQVRIDCFHGTSSLPRNFAELYEKLPLHETTSSLFVNALRRFEEFDRLRCRFRRRWEKKLQDGEEMAEVVLLLTVLPNVRSLCLAPPRFRFDNFMLEFLNDILGPGPPSWTIKPTFGHLRKYLVDLPLQVQQPRAFLRCLESLSLGSCSRSICLQSCISLLSLPALTSFTGRYIEGHLSQDRLAPELTFGHLLHLTLERCRIKCPCLCSVLDRCTALISLKIDSSFAFNIRAEQHIIHTTFMVALQKMTDTLESLTLMMPEFYKPVLLDLRAFQKLRYLEVDMDWLIHDASPPYIYELLPSSIEQLNIRVVDLDILPHLDKLLETFAPVSTLSKLSVMRLYIEHRDEEGLSEGLTSLQECAKEHHIDLEFELEPDDNKWWYWWADREVQFDDNVADSEGSQSDHSDRDE